MRTRTQMLIGPAGMMGLSQPAAFAMAEALGVSQMAVAELLPDVEAAILAALDRQAPDDDLQGRDA